MKIFKRVISDLLIVILAIVLLFNYEPEEVKAATKPPGRPSITASGTGEPGEVLITIDKVQDADGFCIVAKNDKERLTIRSQV